MEAIGIGTCAFRSTVDVSTKGIGPVNPWSPVGTSYSDIQAMDASQSRRICRCSSTYSTSREILGLRMPLDTRPGPSPFCQELHAFETRGWSICDRSLSQLGRSPGCSEVKLWTRHDDCSHPRGSLMCIDIFMLIPRPHGHRCEYAFRSGPFARVAGEA